MLKVLRCQNNNLPYEDIDGYKEYIEEHKNLIDQYGYNNAMKMLTQMNKYNL